MCDPISATIGAAVIGAGMSAVQGSKSRSAQRSIQASNEAQAATQAQRAEEQFNKANQKMPGIDAMWARNKALAGKGLGSTFLTGSGGVPNPSLGGATLLGG